MLMSCIYGGRAVRPSRRRMANGDIEEKPNIKTIASLSRRWLLKVLAAVGGSTALAAQLSFLKLSSTNMLKPGRKPRITTKMKTKNHIAVIGAGAFGGWTALYLLRRGARVTLVDAWGPGNSRASSGGETRVIRGTYGPNQPYTKMAARATQLWKENENRWNQKLMHQTGVLWMVSAGDDHFERESLPVLRDAGIACQELVSSGNESPLAADQSRSGALGNLRAGRRISYRAGGVPGGAERIPRGGGAYKQAAVPPRDLDGQWDSLSLSDGSTLEARSVCVRLRAVAGKLFPEVVGDRIRATSRTYSSLARPPEMTRFTESKLPVWLDHRDRLSMAFPAMKEEASKSR